MYNEECTIHGGAVTQKALRSGCVEIQVKHFLGFLAKEAEYLYLLRYFLLQLFCSRQVPEEIRQLDVVLEEPHHVYFCGEEISGHVKVDLAGCLTVQGL
jgi:hypothetical protein